MTTGSLREEIVWWGRSLFERGLTSGTSGNISVRCEDGFLVTPTNACLGRLDPERISLLDADWRHVEGDKPTKEIALHRPFYAARPQTAAVVHLHSTYSTALSCLTGIDASDALRALTPYVVMKIGVVRVLPYARPGSDVLEPQILEAAAGGAGLLLGNHGPIVSGRTLQDAVSALEEMEEAAKLSFLLRDFPVRYLSADELSELHTVFGSKLSGVSRPISDFFGRIDRSAIGSRPRRVLASRPSNCIGPMMSRPRMFAARRTRPV